MISTLFHQSLQSSLCLTLLYVLWRLLLRRETFFRQNRITLLAIVLVSLVMPFIHINIPVREAALSEIANEQTVAQLVDYTTTRQTDSSTPVDVPAILYIIGVALTAAYHTRGLIRIRQKMTQGCLWKQREQGVTVYCHAGDDTSYNWLNNVVISEADYEHHPEVLAHELAHVRHHHSYDNLLLALCQCLQWFNPFVYWLTASLKEVHEYEADHDVVAGGADLQHYQLLLISKAAKSGHLPLADGFVYKSLKQRLQMMLRTPSASWRRSKSILLLPILVVLLLALAHYDIKHDHLPLPSIAKPEVQPSTDPVGKPEMSTPTAKPTQEKAKAAEPQQQTHALEKEEAEKPAASPVAEPTQMAQFPGGNSALRAYLAAHLPKQDVSGRLFVHFVVNEDGSLRDISILKSGSYEANQAALQLVAAMPRWIPGRKNGQIVASPYTLPIDY